MPWHEISTSATVGNGTDPTSGDDTITLNVVVRGDFVSIVSRSDGQPDLTDLYGPGLRAGLDTIIPAVQAYDDGTADLGGGIESYRISDAASVSDDVVKHIESPSSHIAITKGSGGGQGFGLELATELRDALFGLGF